MPAEGFERVSREEILSPGEIGAVTGIMVDAGITKVRLTGGEPLIRGGLEIILNEISRFRRRVRLAITTNGLVLDRWLDRLATAGISQINISLDTLKRETFRQLTGVDGLTKVLHSIENSVRHPGIEKVKINTVLQRGINDREVADFMAMSHRLNIDVRFIELMPVKGVPWEFDRAVTREDVLNQFPELIPINGNAVDDGPAKYYHRNGLQGRIGFIASLSHPVCGQCNRLRLTARGILLRCLYDSSGLNVRDLLRSGYTANEIKSKIVSFVNDKPVLQNDGRFSEQMLQRSPCLASVGG